MPGGCTLHFFALHSPEDVDEQIIDWLREAYDA